MKILIFTYKYTGINNNFLLDVFLDTCNDMVVKELFDNLCKNMMKVDKDADCGLPTVNRTISIRQLKLSKTSMEPTLSKVCPLFDE